MQVSRFITSLQTSPGDFPPLTNTRCAPHIYIFLFNKVISDTNVKYLVTSYFCDPTIASGSEKVLLRSTVSNWAGGLQKIQHNI